MSPTATDEEIKTAYRRAQRKYHPDVGGSEQDAIRINDAYSCIKDARKRALYERAGRPDYDPSSGRHDAPPRSTEPPRAQPGTQAPRTRGTATPQPASARGGARSETRPGEPGRADPLGAFTDPWGRRWASFRQFQRAFLLQYDDGRGGQRIGPVAGFRDRAGNHWATEDDFRRAAAHAASGPTRTAAAAEQRFEHRLRQQSANRPDPFDLVRDEEGHVWASADQYRWAREEEALHDPGGLRWWIDTTAYGFRAPNGVFWASEHLWRAAEAARLQEQQRQDELRQDGLRRQAEERRRREAAAERAWQVATEAQSREEHRLRLQSQYAVLTATRSAGRALGTATAWVAGLVTLGIGIVVVIVTGAPAPGLLLAVLAAATVAGLWWLLLWLGGRLLGRALSGLTAEELRELR